MKFNFNKLFSYPLLLAGAVLFMASCNKDVEDPTPREVAPPSGQTIAQFVDGDANSTILKAAIARAATSNITPSVASLLNDPSGVYTVFAPTDAAFQVAFQLLGIPPAIGINALRPGQLDTILRYHIVGGQRVTASMMTTFPNVQLPTLFELVKPNLQVPPGLRMSVFPASRAPFAWANNIPIAAADIQAANGVIHRVAVPLLPPSAFLWNRIDADPSLTYLKAALQKADEGSTPATSLIAALQNPAANLTVFAPNNTAFQQILTAQITGALVAQNVPLAQAQATAQVLASSPTVFSNPAVAGVLTPAVVRGIVSYHVLRSRVFSVNIPPAPATTNVQTLVNSAVPAHPGLALQANYNLATVSSATVKGVGNQTASNIQINSSPVNGTSDQHYINGVLHVIDQVLLPQ